MTRPIGAGFVESRVSIRASEEIIFTSGEVTATGGSAVFEVGSYSEGLLMINTTAITGTTKSVAIALETRVGGVWKAVPNLTIAAITAISSSFNAITNFGDAIRMTWTLHADTTDITFTAAMLVKS